MTNPATAAQTNQTPTAPDPEPPDAASNVKQAKATLRATVLKNLRSLTSEERVRDSLLACARLGQTGVWGRAQRLLAFAPFGDELDISPLVEKALGEGKVVALPQYDPRARVYRACQIRCALDQVPVGQFGIREPGRECPSLPLAGLDLILVPGIAFDLLGHRLGRGRGYYDRLLMGLSAVKCGVAFDQQVQVQIPVEPHDILLDCILTPTRWLEV